jgi:hypothetical protein
MNGYELSRDWFNFCYENPEKVKTNHTALYFFAVDHCNRLGWKRKFGLPTEMAKDAIGIKSWHTYIKAFNDLVEWGFFDLIERSKNQYSSNIIALIKNNEALDKALDKATTKHASKQLRSTHQSTHQSIDSIDKLYNKEQINLITKEYKKVSIFLDGLLKPSLGLEVDTCFSFDEFWELYPVKQKKRDCNKKYKTISEKDREKIKNTLSNFISHKPFKDYNLPHPSTYLTQERWNDEIIGNDINIDSQQKFTDLANRFPETTADERKWMYHFCVNKPKYERSQREEMAIDKLKDYA